MIFFVIFMKKKITKFRFTKNIYLRLYILQIPEFFELIMSEKVMKRDFLVMKRESHQIFRLISDHYD
jgi:hypothetical protein